MEITITVPDFKFNVGDVVERKNENNNKSIFLHIYSREYAGEWASKDDKKAIILNKMCYTTIVQKGSYYDAIKLELMRPGIVGCNGINEYGSFDNRGHL